MHVAYMWAVRITLETSDAVYKLGHALCPHMLVSCHLHTAVKCSHGVQTQICTFAAAGSSLISCFQEAAAAATSS